MRARVQIAADYTWPAYAVGDFRSCSARSDETVAVTVTTTLELRPGERFLRVAHELDNRARDHRLRAHFPLPARVDRLRRRVRVHRRAPGLTAEERRARGRAPDVSVAPVRRRVRRHRRPRARARRPPRVRGGRRRRELALTLLRSVGYLSRSEPSLRPNPAGPTVPVAGAQLPGRQRAEYAVLLHAATGAPPTATPPPTRCSCRSSGARDRRRRTRRAGDRRRARVDGAEVSAVLRSPGGLIVRVFRTDADPGPVTIEHEGARPAVGSSTCRAAPSPPSKAPSSSAPGRSAPMPHATPPDPKARSSSVTARAIEGHMATPVRIS